MKTDVLTPKPETVLLKELSPGDAFQYGENIYMKIKGEVDLPNSNCIDLATGALGLLNDTRNVIPLQCAGFSVDFRYRGKFVIDLNDKQSADDEALRIFLKSLKHKVTAEFRYIVADRLGNITICCQMPVPYTNGTWNFRGFNAKNIGNVADGEPMLAAWKRVIVDCQEVEEPAKTSKEKDAAIGPLEQLHILIADGCDPRINRNLYKYLAADKDGRICAYTAIPTADGDKGQWGIGNEPTPVIARIDPTKYADALTMWSSVIVAIKDIKKP